LLDRKTREEAFNIILEPILVRSSSMISESKSMESNISTKEQHFPSFKIENAEVTHLKPSILPLMKQVNILVGISNDLFSLYIYTYSIRMKDYE